MNNEKISVFEPLTLVVGVVLAILSAIICMQIIGKVGVTPNTSLIGAIVAMVIARIPLSFATKFRSLERQNLLQTIVSGAGFSAANCGFLTLAIFYVMGETNILLPMAVGVGLGVTVSIYIVGQLFDSSIYPADAAWPPGVATANAIEAGDQGGAKARRLIEGILLGVVGGYFKLPAAGIGIVFIANLYSMIALGLGLVIRGYSGSFGFDLGATYIPHGVMIGAGLMALIQSMLIIFKKEETTSSSITVDDRRTKNTLIKTVVLFLGISFLIALLTGILTDMTTPKLILWLAWATFSATATMLLVGMAAMHSGWFPAFAITTIFMTIGMFLGFESIPLAVLTGFVSAVGPCFADMGYDLKTGWILRGRGENRELELQGRKNQVIMEILGGLIGIIVVYFTMNLYFEIDVMPPVSRVFATTIEASADAALIRTLVLWAIPGFIIQLVGGSSKMVGVLFATGLLIHNPIYGLGVLFAVVVRLIAGTEFMEIRDAGLIAGDGLYGFFAALIKAIV